MEDMLIPNKKRHIRKWIRNLSKIRPELGNFSICPFASTAKFAIFEENLHDIVPSNDFDVIIYIVEDHHDCDTLYKAVENYNLQYKEYKFLPDHRNEDTFINGVQSNNGKYNLVLVQPREDLTEARKKLAKANYYDTWDEDYLKDVLEGDYNTVIDTINNQKGHG